MSCVVYLPDNLIIYKSSDAFNCWLFVYELHEYGMNYNEFAVMHYSHCEGMKEFSGDVMKDSPLFLILNQKNKK